MIYSIFSLIFFLASSRDIPKRVREITTPTTIMSTAMTMANGIHNGLVTHHQDQSILPVSLRMRNMRNSTIDVLIPEDDLDDAIFN